MIGLKYFFAFSLFIFSINKSQKPILSEYEVMNAVKRNAKNNAEEVIRLNRFAQRQHYKKAELLSYLALQEYYLDKNNYALSFQYSQKGEGLAKQLADDQSMSRLLKERGKLNIILGSLNQADKDLRSAVDFANKVKDYTAKQILLSAAYANMGGLFEGKSQHDSILFYMTKSLWAIEKLSHHKLPPDQYEEQQNLLIYGNLNMGSFYTYFHEPQDLDKASPFFLFALKQINAYKNSPDELKLDVLHALGRFYMQKKEFSRSISFYENALKINTKVKNKQTQLYLYKDLTTVYYTLHDLEMENKYLKLYAGLNDSIRENDKKSIVQRTDLQIAEKDKTLNEKYSIQNKKIMSVIIVFFSLVLLITYWRYYKNTKKPLIRNEATENDSSSSDNVDASAAISAETEDKLMKKLIGFEDNEKFLKSDIKLSSLAHQLKTNTKYLSMLIKKRNNQNFTGYINQLRIRYIIKKLRTHPKYMEYKISYLAEECGYSSTQVFVIAFKKETGQTPSQYLELMRANIEERDPE